MEFWKAYFTVVEVLKHKLNDYEKLIVQLAEKGSQALESNSISKKYDYSVIKNILIVEPLERNRVLMVHYLKALPVKIEFVKSKDEVQNKTSEKTFDLVVDLNESGLEFPMEKASFQKFISSKL